jgi:hypothetical protein
MEPEFYMNAVTPEFLSKMRLIDWKAGQWMQFTGYDVDNYHHLTFHFKSSTYGIGFDVSIKLFYQDQDEAYLIPFNKVYEYFRDVKYKEFGERIY